MESKELIYQYALSLLNTPYRWGGDDPIEGYDCSGLVVELLKAVGLLKRGEDLTAAGLSARFPSVVLKPQFGDLAFYGKLNITHVGFCLNSELMIEAGGGGSSTTSLAAAAKENAYIRIRPISSRSDINIVKRPDYPWRD